MKINISYIIIVFICYGCCKKDAPLPNKLKGKIKSIKEILITPSKNYYYDLIFVYDTIDGALQKITLNDKPYVKISKKINNYIILDYDVSVRDSTAASNNLKIKVNIGNNGYIDKMEYVDSSLIQLQDLLNIYTNNQYPDSIREFVGGFTTESKHYNFQVKNGNIIQSIHDYSGFLSGDNSNTLKYFYTEYKNNNILPAQFSSVYFYSAAYSTTATDPLYLLGINGYQPYRSNINLLDSIVNIEDNVTLKYKYTTNLFYQIIKMSRYSNITNSSYDIEYYK